MKCNFFLLLSIVGTSLLLFIFGIPFLKGGPVEFFASGLDLKPASGNHSLYMLANITINGFNLLADVPTTNDQFQKGLDIKDHIKVNEGMLFIFKQPGKYPFWMHGMKFPIDIIWLDNDSNVVHVEHNLSPCLIDLMCPTYSPERDAMYVLETKAGFSERHNVKTGSHMNYHLIR
jgi:uncharacterized protein